MKLLKGKKGFTLIELVVVIAILGILAGIAIPRFLDATATARGSKIVADMRTIDSAIVIYNAKTGSMPADTAAITTDVAATGTALPKYKLLAAWPVGPTGTAIITNNAGKAITLKSTAARTYGLDSTNGRAYLGSTTTDTVDVLLALTADKEI